MQDCNDARRRFLSAAGAAWVASQFPAIAAAAVEARDAQAAFDALTPAQARELEAVAARIIPTDDTPGAKEAGAIWFIDRALAGPMQGMRAPILGGLEALTAAAGGDFSSLTPDRQDALLAERENSAFFGLTRLLTLGGVFAMPAHGGNRHHVGWQLIGFDHRHAWSPPFGHYDVGQHGGES